MFAVDAFTDYLQTLAKKPQYAITFREGRTSQVIQDVVTQRSQIGIIFISKMTQKFMTRTLRKNRLKFTELFSYPPSVFLQANHPLAQYPSLSIDQLRPYPYIQYTQEEDSYQLPKRSSSPTSSPTGKSARPTVRLYSVSSPPPTPIPSVRASYSGTGESGPSSRFP